MRIFLIMLTAFFLVQCGDHPEHMIIDTWANGKTKKEVIQRGEDSTVQTFYMSGSIEKNQVYEKGEKSGMWSSYYEDGTMWSEHHYLKGAQIGVYRTWHPNGKPFIDGSYNDLGKPDGHWIIKDSEGNILRSIDGEDINP